MNDTPVKLRARADRKSAKRNEKKRKIAESAIGALKDLGYANTSLRDIAANSEMSLGMLHYYFDDRSELIIYCVQIYKEEFVGQMLDALANASGRAEVIEAFSEALVVSIVDDKMTHKLWYDIRTQAMFDDTFRPVVAEIEASLIDIVRTTLRKAGHESPADVELQYALLDGVFRFLMQGQIGDTPMTRDDLKTILKSLIERFV